MVFIYLLGIALIGMVIIVGIEYSTSKKPLLQIVKNWCNIDSVHFEEQLKKTGISFTEKSNAIGKSAKKHSESITQWSIEKSTNFRSSIRKKLHPDQNKQKESHFITKMKQD